MFALLYIYTFMYITYIIYNTYLLTCNLDGPASPTRPCKINEWRGETRHACVTRRAKPEHNTITK